MKVSALMRKIKRLFRVLDFSLLGKASLVVYDSTATLEDIRPYLAPYDYVLLPTRQERVYLYPLALATLGSLLFGKSLYDSYVDSFLRIVKPSVIVTSVDNDTRFYALSVRHPHIKTIMIQNGRRTRNKGVFSKLELDTQRKVDYMLLHSEPVSELYGSLIQGTCINIGSLRANKYQEFNAQPLPRTVICISNWGRKNSDSDYYCTSEKGELVSHQVFYKANKILFDHCRKWCTLNGYNLLLLSSQRKNSRHLDEEREFFGLDNSSGIATFYVSGSSEETYGLIKRSTLNIGVDSTLLYESLAYGLKTVFFQVRGELLGWPDWNFGWPLNVEKEGSYWTSTTTYKRFSELVESMIETDSLTWSAIVNKARRSIIGYNPGNTILVHLLHDLLA